MREASSEKRATATTRRSPSIELQPVLASTNQTTATRAAITPRPSDEPADRCRARFWLPPVVVEIVFELRLEPVPLPVDLLRAAIRLARRPTTQRADEEVHLQAERDQEDDEDRDAVAKLARPQDPRQHEDDERDANPEPRIAATVSHAATVAAIPGRASLVRVLRGAVVRERRPRTLDQELDRICEVVLGDVVIAALDAKLVRLEQNVRVGVAERRLEAIRGELDQEAERILEVDRVHEAAVFHAGVL